MILLRDNLKDFHEFTVQVKAFLEEEFRDEGDL